MNVPWQENEAKRALSEREAESIFQYNTLYHIFISLGTIETRTSKVGLW